MDRSSLRGTGRRLKNIPTETRGRRGARIPRRLPRPGGPPRRATEPCPARDRLRGGEPPDRPRRLRLPRRTAPVGPNVSAFRVARSCLHYSEPPQQAEARRHAPPWWRCRVAYQGGGGVIRNPHTRLSDPARPEEPHRAKTPVGGWIDSGVAGQPQLGFWTTGVAHSPRGGHPRRNPTRRARATAAPGNGTEDDERQGRSH